MTLVFSADEPEHEFRYQTEAVRAGIGCSSYGEQSEAIFTSSSFQFGSAAEAAARFAGEDDGFIYSRFSNPTVANFERRLAVLEGGEACIATASGMAAIATTVFSLLASGDHIVASRSMFGSTVNLFDKVFSRFGVSVSWVELTDPVAWEQAIKPSTRMLFVETPTNPLTQLADIAALSQLARSQGALMVVDNCFCTPALQRPLQFGADIVIHSATKYIDGQGRCIGGAIVGPAELLENQVLSFMRSGGPTMSPFNAWVFLKGLETLSLRMRAHCDNARQLAEWLQSQSAVERVFYPGLDSHPQHELARQQQDDFGAVVSFEVSGDRAAAWRVIDAVRLLSITANLGDAKTTITHPATTTHGRISEDDRKAAGIRENLIRVAVGLEHIDDIVADLERGLGA